jgi:hypothetical protein
VSAGQVWQRPDGLVWVEVQAAAVEPSGWRLMIPLVELGDAPDAPPLVVTVDRHRARVHLLASAPQDELGEAAGELDPDHVIALQQAVQRLVAT